MGEFAAWLDLTYPYGRANPRQTLFLHDPLTCKEHVEFVHESIPRPKDWLSPSAHYAPMLCYYDDEVQLIYEEGSAAPFRFFDYRKGYRVAETQVYPEEKLPELKVCALEIKTEGTEPVLTGRIEASGDCDGYPLAVWGVPGGLTGENVLDLDKAVVAFVRLRKGENHVRVMLRRQAPVGRA
jgi:hypothetical protein